VASVVFRQYIGIPTRSCAREGVGGLRNHGLTAAATYRNLFSGHHTTACPTTAARIHRLVDHRRQILQRLVDLRHVNDRPGRRAPPGISPRQTNPKAAHRPGATRTGPAGVTGGIPQGLERPRHEVVKYENPDQPAPDRHPRASAAPNMRGREERDGRAQSREQRAARISHRKRRAKLAPA